MIAVAGAILAQSPSTTSPDNEAAKLVKDVASLWHKRQFDDALLKAIRVQDEYAMSSAAPDAGLWASRALVAVGDPISAMEELQLVRNRWPRTSTASVALAHNSILRRLYARPNEAAAYGAPEKISPERIDPVTSLAVTSHNAVFRAGEKGVEVVQTADGDRLPSGAFTRPRLTTDNEGALVVIDGGRLVPPPPGKPLVLTVPRLNKAAEALEKIETAVQLSNGDWLVMDANDKAIQRFARDGSYLQPFESTPGKDGPVKVSHLAANAFDEVAGLDDGHSRVVLFDASGAVKGTIPYKRRNQDFRDSQDVAYELKDPRDLAFDAFGHLYVLDPKAVAIFSPYAPAVPGRAPVRPAADVNRGDDFRLRTLFVDAAEKGREGFRATAFAVDRAGAIFLYDETLKQMVVYR